MSSVSELSIETKLTDFLPAPATVFTVALALTFFVTIQHCRTNPLTLAVNAFGDLFPSTKPKEILVRVSQVPTPAIKVPPTPTVEYRYQPELTSNVLYAVALCAVCVLVGAIIIVLRKRSTTNTSSPSSSINRRFDIDSARQASDNCNLSSSLVGDIPESLGSDLANDSDKNAPGLLEKFKSFL